MGSAPAPSKPSRTPWIIAGVVGCVIICLLFAVVGALGLVMFSSQSTPEAQSKGAATAMIPFGTLAPASAQPTQAATAVSAPAASNTPAPTNTTVPATNPPSTLPKPTALLSSPTASRASPTAPPTARPSPSRTPTSSPFDLVGVPTPMPPTATVRPTQALPSPTTKPTVSANNYLIAFSKDEGPADEAKKLWLMNSDGTDAFELGNLASHPILNRDGKQMAFYHWKDGIYLLNWTDIKNITLKKLVGDTFTGGDYGSGDWSHDGRWIAFTRQPGGKGNIVIDVIAPDGTNPHTVQIGESPSWSPDDTMLAFHTCRGSNCGIYKGSINGGDAIPIVTDDGGLPAWSPDGKWIVYQKDVDGQKQLFLISPEGSGKRQLTSGPAMHVDAAWSPDGGYIFYRTPEGGSWGIWRMNVDGSNRVKLIDNVPPVNWPYERLSISR